MRREIIISRTAHKQIISNKQYAKAFLEKIKQLEQWPDVLLDIKSLKNRNDYRLRVGNWRIFFVIHPKHILITEIKKRDDNTY
jgi:mRNA interferase RelE/StbE